MFDCQIFSEDQLLILKLYLIVLSSCKQISFLLHRNKGGVKQNNFEQTPSPLLCQNKLKGSSCK